MGKGNIIPNGRFDCVYYVDYDCINVYSKKGTEETSSLRDISYKELDEYEYCECESFDNYLKLKNLVVDYFLKHFGDMHIAKDKWFTNCRVIVENDLYSVCIQDNEWSIAVELIANKDICDQKLSCEYGKYKKALMDALFEYSDEIWKPSGPWTSERIKKEGNVL